MPTVKKPAVITAQDGVEIRSLCLPGVIQDGTANPYLVTDDVIVLVDTSTTVFDLDLTAAEVDGRVIMVYDVGGNCYTNPVTISSGGASITGKNLLNQDNGVVGYVYNEANTTWYSIINETTKAGVVPNGDFSGSPYKATVLFGGSSFIGTNYAVTITGEDARTWTVESKGGGGFDINSNSSTVLTGYVYWTAIGYTE